MDSIKFLPLYFELGLLRVEFSKSCVALKRKDREFPHVSLFYEKKPNCVYWWPHITWAPSGRDRHEELGRLYDSHGIEIEQRLQASFFPRFQAVLRPTSLGDLHDDGWLVIMPSFGLVSGLFQRIIARSRLIVLDELEKLLQHDEMAVWGPLFDLLVENAVDPISLKDYRPTSCLGLARAKDNRIDEGFLYGWDFGGTINWFMTTGHWMDLSPDEMMRIYMPNFMEVFTRILDVLEIPIPGVNVPEKKLVLPSATRLGKPSTRT